MKLEDIMSTKVKSVSPDTPAEEAWEQMQFHEIRHLVVREEGQVVGILSERDLGGPAGNGRREGRTATDLMQRDVVEAKPTTTVRQAANLLRGYQIGCLPVTKKGKLKGIVTISDLLELIGRGTQRPRRDLTRVSPRVAPGGRR